MAMVPLLHVDGLDFDEVAKDAYGMADAMLEARRPAEASSAPAEPTP
jgi:hypothetical protein